ncbi:hypothetical protein H2203_006764 [Taxawa tesnikishii (nom. ined.)]|nr:hypothetical protein H2203_006764 [Dothideales sp. JES 119]
MVRSNIRLPPVLSRRCDDTEKHSDFDNREDYILTEHETLYAFDPLASNDLGPYGYTPGAEMKHVAGEASARLQALVRSGPRWKPVYIIVRRLERTVNEQLTPPQSRHWAIRVEEYVWDIAKDGKPFGNCLFNGKKRWSEVRKNYPQVFLMGLTRKTVREIDRDASDIAKAMPAYNAWGVNCQNFASILSNSICQLSQDIFPKKIGTTFCCNTCLMTIAAAQATPSTSSMISEDSSFDFDFGIDSEPLDDVDTVQEEEIQGRMLRVRNV